MKIYICSRCESLTEIKELKFTRSGLVEFKCSKCGHEGFKREHHDILTQLSDLNCIEDTNFRKKIYRKIADKYREKLKEFGIYLQKRGEQ